jgi:hypothetical protein
MNFKINSCNIVLSYSLIIIFRNFIGFIMTATTLDSPYNLAFVSEAVFGSSKDKQPILATDGLRSCIGFSGRDALQKIGFLAHFMGPAQVDEFFATAPKVLASLACDPKASLVFDCDLIGGSEKTSASKEIIKKIKTYIATSPIGIIFRIKREEPPSKGFVLKSLTLDLRDGTSGTYDPENDPSPRKRTSEEEARIGSMDLFEHIVLRV